MIRPFSLLALALGLFLAMAAPALAQVASDGAESTIEEFAAGADGLEEQLKTPELVPDASIEQRRAELENWRQRLTKLSTDLTPEIQPLQSQLDLLGEPQEGVTEPPEIVAQRKQLADEVERLRALQRRADQAAARAASLSDRLNRLRRDRFTDELLNRGRSPVSMDQFSSTWRGLKREYDTISREISERLASGGMMQSVVDRLTLPAILGLFAIFFAVIVRRWLLSRIMRRVSRELPRGRRIWLAAGATLARFLLPALAVFLVLIGINHSGIAGPMGTIYIVEMTRAAGVIIGVYALSGAFYSPDSGLLRLSGLDDATAGRAHRWLVTLTMIVACDRILVRAGEETGLTLSALSVLNAALLVAGGFVLWQFVRNAGFGTPVEEVKPDAEAEPDAPEVAAEVSPVYLIARAARYLIFGVAVISPVLALAGYFAASRFLFYPALQSIGVIGFGIFVYSVICEIAAAGDPRRRTSDEVPGGAVGLVPVIAGFLLFVAATPVLALIWGASVTDLHAAWTRLVEGFSVGDVTIAPVDFLIFIVVFGIGFTLTRALQGVLRRSVLPVTRLDAGAKSAIQAGVGYIGIVVAALIAISTTGLDLSNLAIVAGALSVGIGFGLQNIVNNFVSGVILLIERPIKTGDWVEIGGVHGTVQQVNVRSTEIQTFDRSTMFVPNADLISGTVTNWTHSNNQGRLIVPVGVAYGSDVRKVEKILTEIAQAHPMLLRRPSPYVIFTGFGADSLDFEIRGVLRDVLWILNVASEIRFSVYEKFAEAGIEIPFAQRDLHIKNLDELARIMRGQLSKPGEHEVQQETESDGGGSGDASAPDAGGSGK